jgi:diguanylate cyclase (GGDEF)-like protein
VPLTAHSETLGLLHIQGGTTECGPTNVPPNAQIESTKQFTIAMARHIALALANLRLGERLRNQSIRDALTGMFNRRFMEESLERELRRAARNNQSVALLMIDIDHFKQFNDTFGHQAGDSLLRAFGNFLKQRTRGQDVACRYGGEEFLVILADAAVEGACQRAEILRKELTELMVQHAGQSLAAISVSIGVAACPNHGITAEELVHAADQALYRAKHEGRNRVVVA